jgi:alkaline phosphatase D
MFTAAVVVAAFVSTASPAALAPATDKPITTIAMGSCLRENRPAPVLEAAAKTAPDVFLWLGDNIYADSLDMQVFRDKYAKLEAQPGMQILRRLEADGTMRMLATWDDHDFGDNDLGREYPKKAETQALFMDFWKVPQDSPRRAQQGVYDSIILGPGPSADGTQPGQRVQIILLDTRTHRTALNNPNPRPPRLRDDMPADERAALQARRDAWENQRTIAQNAGYPGGYMPTTLAEPNATTPTDTSAAPAEVLGEAQWAWLEAQLRKPAEIRLIATSIQFVSEEHRFENWANFPNERLRMVRLLNATDARGVIFLSGDRHWSEVSVLQPGKLTTTPPTLNDPRWQYAPAPDQPRYPLWDITSSALNQPRSRGSWELNAHRVGAPLMTASFGLMTIDWPSQLVTFEFRDERGTRQMAQQIDLRTLQPIK